MKNGIGALAAVVAALVAGSASADDKIMTGVACVSDGASIAEDSGARLSTATNSPGDRATTFVCPLVRDTNTIQPFDLGVRINTRNALFAPSSTFRCRVRSVTRDAQTVTETEVMVPGRSDAGDNGFKSVAISPIGIPIPELSYVLVCTVPDVSSGMRSGIVSYKWME